ncbi:thiol-disulfide isomerase [Halobacillus litoralis]|uniref:Thiol-disulfide isomerase n=1 Tax=Halobacillus litoralis TaxID=45668 RepID=A0A410MGE3_9BACI|nr:thiol-disulfide isomerase [Halobacillus litoralis]
MIVVSEVILYTRNKCPLCEEVRNLITLFNVDVIEIDIETDPVLLENYMFEVPVLKIDNYELDYRSIDYFELEKRLQ